MAAKAATSKYNNPVMRGAGLHHEDFRRENLSSEEALWADIYLSLPHGRCAASNCGCLRYRIHPHSLEPHKVDSSQLCHGCHHDQSFHAIGEEQEIEYGLKVRKTLFQYITLLKKRALFSSASMVKGVHDTELKHPNPVQPSGPEPDTKPHDVAEFMEAMKVTIDGSSLLHRQNAFVPGTISPSRSPPVEPEAVNENADLPATAEGHIATQGKDNLSPPAQTHHQVAKPEAELEREENFDSVPGGESEVDVKKDLRSEELPVARHAANEEPSGKESPLGQPSAFKWQEYSHTKPIPLTSDEPVGPETGGSARLGQSAEPPLSFHMHQDSAHTVEPFDITQNSSGNSSPAKTPLVQQEGMEKVEHQKATSQSATLDRPTQVLRNSGVDAEEVNKRLQPSSPETDEAIDEETGEEAIQEEQVKAAEQPIAHFKLPRQSPQPKSNAPPSATQGVKTAAALPSNDWNHSKTVSTQGLTANTRAGRDRLDAEHGCYHCKQIGHFQRECPELRVEDFESAEAGTSVQFWYENKPSVCPTCYLRDHTAEDCPGMERAHLVATPALSRATSHKGKAESSVIDLGKSRHASQKYEELARSSEALRPTSNTSAIRASSVTETIRGRPEVRNPSLQKPKVTLPTEPSIKIWEDNDDRPETHTRADGKPAYKAWWIDDENEGPAGKDGASGLSTGLAGNSASYSTKTPNWGGMEHDAGWNNDDAEDAGQSHTDGWNTWAAEVAVQSSQLSQARRGSWVDSPQWNGEAHTDDRQPPRLGRGRGRGNIHASDGWDNGPSGKDRPTKPATKLSTKPHLQTTKNLHAAAASSTKATGSVMASTAVPEVMIKEGGANKANPQPLASANGKGSKEQIRNTKPIKRSPPGQGSLATRHKKEQRRRKREREAAELALRASSPSTKGNRLGTSPSLDKKNVEPRGRYAGKSGMTSTSGKKPSNMPPPATPPLIDLLI